MCGILGGYSLKHNEEHFQKALKYLEHRGPYNSGMWSTENISICMTQLPMSSREDVVLPLMRDDLVISYNGEVFDELKQSEGINDEISVILDAVIEGILCDGMYAIAMYSKTKNTISLVRDQFGIKPVYYYYSKERSLFLFSSELKPLLELLGKVAVNYEVVAQIVATGVSLNSNTVFSGISILEPSSKLVLELNSFALSIEKLRTPEKLDELELKSQIRQSVDACSTSFRNIGLLISGGLDSNLIHSFLSNDTAKFHVSVQGNVEEVVVHNNNLHTTHLSEADFWSSLNKAIAALGFPCRMTSILMYQKLAELVSESGYRGVMIGEGADELFWGYPRHLNFHDCNFNLSPEQIVGFYFGNYTRNLSMVRNELRDLVNISIQNIIREKKDIKIDDFIEFMEMKYSLEPLLRRADHILMSKIIEARLPFLHRSVPHIAKCFGRERLRYGIQKSPLNGLAKNQIKNYVERKKVHFRIPLSNWEIVSREIDGFLSDNAGTLKSLGIINVERNLIDSLGFAQKFTLVTIVIWYHNYREYLHE